jgi:energy-converting hydrogenase Eha subunit G
MYPAITVRKNGFRIHSLIGKSRWLAWDAIKKARRVELPRRFWMIGIKGLGWLYWPTGFSFWLWMPGIHLTQSIDDYHGLMRVLKEKRPDLFAPYR